MTYLEALERAPEPRVPVLGPVPCKRCGAWLEWLGAEWVNVGTDGRHQCATFLDALAANALEVEVVAAWVRPSTGLAPVRMAHPVSEPLPAWVRTLGACLMLCTALAAVALGLELVARYLA